MAAAAHFLIRKKLFNSKYPQLQITKDFAVAEKTLHLAANGRKYDLGKKAPHKRTASGKIPTATKMSTQDQEQQHTQSDTITETPEASQMSEPKMMMMMMKVFWTLLHHQKHFPQKIRSPPQNPIADHNFKKKKNFLVYQNIVICFQL